MSAQERAAPASAVEPAAPDDLPAIRELLRGAGLPDTDLTLAHLADFCVLREGDMLVGVAGLEVHGSDGLLRSVGVAADRRGRGLGAALAAAIEARARASSLRALYLLTTTAGQYFERRGYRRIGRDEVPAAVQASREFAALCPASATCMVKAPL